MIVHDHPPRRGNAPKSLKPPDLEKMHVFPMFLFFWTMCVSYISFHMYIYIYTHAYIFMWLSYISCGTLWVTQTTYMFFGHLLYSVVSFTHTHIYIYIFITHITPNIYKYNYNYIYIYIWIIFIYIYKYKYKYIYIYISNAEFLVTGWVPPNFHPRSPSTAPSFVTRTSRCDTRRRACSPWLTRGPTPTGHRPRFWCF